MNADMVIGIGFLVLAVVSHVVFRRSSRVWVRRVADGGTFAGWFGFLMFGIAPLVPSSLVAFVLLGGVVVAVLAAAVVGTRRTRQK
jgi:hypothetical protein